MIAFVRGVRALSRLSGVLAAAMILLSVLIVCQMVFMRYVLNASTVWQTETVIYLMIGATLVGMPYVQLLRGHINVDLLPIYLPAGLRKILFVVCVIVQIAACGVLAYFGLHLFLEALQGGWRSSSVFGTPLWIPYLALPLGFGLLILQYVADLLMLPQVSDPFAATAELSSPESGAQFAAESGTLDRSH
ncbi:MAG: TRAP transporter small permease subunit [Rhodocyclaceae bacterium]